MTIEHDVQEVKDRCRRIETRLTKYLEVQGFDTQRRMPVWRDSGEIVIPSMDCSVADIMASIPKACDHRNILVTHKGEELFVITDL